MAGSQAAKSCIKEVRPLMSIDATEARKRVITLYKSWYRQLPYIVMLYDIPKNLAQCREKLREEFMKNSRVKDIRVIDMLVIKGQMDLRETEQMWRQKGHIMTYFKDTTVCEPNDFLSKFLSGNF